MMRPSYVPQSIGRWLAAVVLFVVGCAATVVAEPEWAWRRWEYVNMHDIEITVAPDRLEMPTGDTATFTVTVRNRTDKCVNVPFFSGQHADLAVFHERTEIWRWSQYNRYTWREAPHSLPINPGDTLTYPMMWRAVDRTCQPLPQGDYRAVGMLMTNARRAMSNTATIRLTPPRRYRDTIYVKLLRPFEIRLPQQLDGQQVYWQPYFDYNDNRLGVIKSRDDGENTTVMLMPNRLGHVTINFLGFKPLRGKNDAKERRTFRIEVVDYDPQPRAKAKLRPAPRPAPAQQTEPTVAPAADTTSSSSGSGSGSGNSSGSGSSGGRGSHTGGTAVITSLDGNGSGSASGSGSPVATSPE